MFRSRTRLLGWRRDRSATAPRSTLATSDKGVILYHKLLMENIEKVQRGEDPMFTIRDMEENVPYIHVQRERASAKMITR